MDESVHALTLDEHLPDPGAAIWLARRYDLPGILPSAYLALCSVQDVDRPWNNGWTTEHPAESGGHVVRKAYLDDIDFARRDQVIKLLHTIRQEVETNRWRPASCTRLCNTVETARTAYRESNWAQGKNALLAFKQNCKSLSGNPNFCPSCRLFYRQILDHVRRDTWKRLLKCFAELPGEA